MYEWHQIYDKTQICIKYHRHSYYTKNAKNIMDKNIRAKQ